MKPEDCSRVVFTLPGPVHVTCLQSHESVAPLLEAWRFWATWGDCGPFQRLFTVSDQCLNVWLIPVENVSVVSFLP